jgi:hypothetical protein
VVEEFSVLLHRHQIWTVHGDRYAGEWPREAFQQRGISYEVSQRSKSELYQAFLPLVNSRLVALLEHRQMQQQLLALERRVTRGGRDSIDHPPGAHDDVANAVAGACVLALHSGSALPLQRVPSHAISEFDPLASAEDNILAMARAEQRAGWFSGPGWAPTWHGDDQPQQRG